MKPRPPGAVRIIAGQLRGSRLPVPDHPGLLQTYVWQDLDLAPRFPELSRFLEFWQRELDGKLHSVKIASQRLIRPAEIRIAGFSATLH